MKILSILRSRARILSLLSASLIIPTSIAASAPADDHSVKMDRTKRQMLLLTTEREARFYDPSTLSSVDFDNDHGTVSINHTSGDWTDTYASTVSHLSFTSGPQTVPDGRINNGGVTLTEARGWLESLYVKWLPLPAATSYRVYVKDDGDAGFTQIDRELIRNYGDYARADIVGLPAGNYSVRVVPVISGNPDETLASSADAIIVKAHDRSGFAHHNYSDIGAYRDNGVLKDDARVIYVTARTARTVKCKVRQSKKDGDGTEFTGLQAIINAYQKGYETRPLAVRLIGLIKDTDMDALLSSAEGLQIKGKNNTVPLNITIEGIGDDATTWGFGFLLRNAFSVELRNFANMLCMDDCISIDTNNRNCWIHHLDLFYGQAGSDSDQAKGDGTIDIKGKSTFITVAYNRFHDSGKSLLCGMKSETTDSYIDYHHNWFDHSDSRHPRVRTISVHVWNNYYDGCAKYGAGATMGASIFVENNFYRASRNPMLISQQGHDPAGKNGTFSNEDGGMIKSTGNIYADVDNSGRMLPATHRHDAISFDCFEATNPGETVPASFTSVYGANSYNNFDTDPLLMHAYTPHPTTDVPAIVTGHFGAGRLNHGDFIWDFDYPGADSDYSVITALKTALTNYTSGFIGHFDE
ncbi:MAG: pectate lyase [Staphylococcus sp.]|nr:pectate lyase [Staphylococcus sp.]